MTKKKENEINEEEFAVKELLVFLKYDLKLSEKRWERFCLHWGDKDISTIIAYCKKNCDTKVTPKVARYLEFELKEEAHKIKRERKKI